MKRVLAGLAMMSAVPATGSIHALTPRPLHAVQEFVSASRTLETPPDTATQIRGQVRSEDSDRPLPYVFVEAASGATRLISVTDREGRYALHGIDGGRWVVRAFALDHAPLEVEVVVPGAGPVQVDLTLPVRPLGLPPIVASVLGIPRPVVSRRTGSPSAALAPEAGDAELRALESTPGAAELGLAQAARGGVGPDPIDPSSILYVRGAASDLKLVLLDGAPVYAPFHLGGLMEAFHPDALESSRLFLGGAPSRYDGGVSYVLDLRSRPGNGERLGGGGAVDLLSFRQRLEGPVGPFRLMASGRAIHGSALHETVTGDPLPYGYGDALARVDLPLGVTSDLSGTFFWNRESVQFDSISLAGGPARWGNTAGSLRYSGALEGGRIDVTAALGLFETRLPLGDDTVTIAAGRSQRMRFGVDYARDVNPSLSAGWGISYDRTELEQLAGEPGHLLRPVGGGTGETAGVYGETVWSATDELELRTGLRSDMFLSARKIRLAPRVTATWQLDDAVMLSIAAGRFHQVVRTPETILGGDLDGLTLDEIRELASAAEGIPIGADLTDGTLGVAGATHVVVGLENRLRDGLELGVEGFLKAFDEIPGAADDLRASGVDLWVHRGGSERWSGWVGYSLAFVWTGDTADGETAFAGRHLLTSGLEARLNNGVVLEARLAYGAGLPFTSIPVTRGSSPQFGAGGAPTAALSTADVPGALGTPASVTPELPTGEGDDEEPPLAGAPPGSYLRVDGKISRSWLAHLGGVDVEFVPYVKVLNALDRRDALFFQFDPSEDVRARSLSAVPILPVLGVEWRL